MKDRNKDSDKSKHRGNSCSGNEVGAEQVRIERRHLPLTLIFREENMKNILELAVGNDEVLLRRLQTSRRTFHQVVELFDGYGMEQARQERFSQMLDEMDQESPLPLDEVCEYLKEGEWTLDLLDLGLYKVEVWKGQAWSYPVRKVHKFCSAPNNEDISQHILELSSGEGRVQVIFSSGEELQAFWKEILLYGRAEVREETDAVIYSN